MEDQDEFETDKGIKDDYDGVVIDAYFQAGEQGDTNLVLKKKADDGDEVEDRYRVGPDWASFDGGVTVEHPSRSKVPASSQLATLVERAFDAGARDEMKQRSIANGRKGQKTAKLWPGLKFHWDVEARPFDFTDRKTGEPVKGMSYKSYPSKFLGIASVDQSVENNGASDQQAEMPPDIMARLKVLAQSKPFNEWVDEALTIDWVRENLLSALSDESYYNTLRGGS